MPNSVKPADIIEAAVNAGAAKASLSLWDLILRGMYSGVMLGIATTFSAMGTTQTGLPLVGALLFPCGFMMIVLFGFELVTGNMMLIPMAILARRTSPLRMLKNLTVVWVANLLGTSLYVALFYGSITQFGEIPDGGALGKTIINIGQTKTVKYVEHGGLGWAACFIRAILCNFLVCFATLGALCSTATVGKLLACWIPIMTFVALGYEHVVVNMFVIPCSMTLGSGVTWGEWWGWNLVPATLGNILGAVLMVSLPMWATWGHEYRKKSKLDANLEISEIASPRFSCTGSFTDADLVHPLCRRCIASPRNNLGHNTPEAQAPMPV